MKWWIASVVQDYLGIRAYLPDAKVAAVRIDVRVVGQQGANGDPSITRNGSAEVTLSDDVYGRAVLSSYAKAKNFAGEEVVAGCVDDAFVDISELEAGEVCIW